MLSGELVNFPPLATSIAWVSREFGEEFGEVPATAKVEGNWYPLLVPATDFRKRHTVGETLQVCEMEEKLILYVLIFQSFIAFANFSVKNAIQNYLFVQ